MDQHSRSTQTELRERSRQVGRDPQKDGKKREEEKNEETEKKLPKRCETDATAHVVSELSAGNKPHTAKAILSIVSCSSRGKVVAFLSKDRTCKERPAQGERHGREETRLNGLASYMLCRSYDGADV